MPYGPGVPAAELLSLYDAHVRATERDRLPEGWVGEQDGPLLRCRNDRFGFTMLTADASALSGADLAGLVDRTVAWFAAAGRPFEWKTFDHDRADLLPLLAAAGGVPGEHEALVMGEAAPLATAVALPDGLTMREVTARADLDAIGAMESAVWGDDRSWLADDLAERLLEPVPPRVFVVEDRDLVVSAGWLTPVVGTPVAGLWGGSTLAAYRGRGIYRALVARRARLALDLGYSVLQVDASDDSRPILERLGLTVVGGTTPYEFTAPAPTSAGSQPQAASHGR